MACGRASFGPIVAVFGVIALSNIGGSGALANARESLHEASDCTSLFGDEDSRLRNKKNRRRNLYWIDDADSDEDPNIVVHSNVEWKAPKPMRVEGLAVVGVSDEGSKETVVVKLAPSMARRVGCASGRYLLTVDDDLGSAPILAVLEEGVLVTHRGELGFVPMRDREMPQWLMAWGSRWRIIPPRTRSSVTKSKSQPRRKKKDRRRR